MYVRLFLSSSLLPTRVRESLPFCGSSLVTFFLSTGGRATPHAASTEESQEVRVTTFALAPCLGRHIHFVVLPHSSLPSSFSFFFCTQLKCQKVNALTGDCKQVSFSVWWVAYRPEASVGVCEDRRKDGARRTGRSIDREVCVLSGACVSCMCLPL